MPDAAEIEKSVRPVLALKSQLAGIKAEETRRVLAKIKDGAFRSDPLGFVLAAYPWGQDGALRLEEGPDENQREFLTDLGTEVRKRAFNGRDPVMPILMAETKGHGTGASTKGAWIADWILSTRPHSIGTVTAGTYTQLETRTWAAILRWTKLCVTAPWFEVQKSVIYHKQDPEFWKVVPQTCKEDNAQSFAGQHAKNSTSWYIFDESSEVGDAIFTTAEGGLTDGEPMMFAWGQPVRNSGKLHRVCFTKEGAHWNIRRTDSRKSRFTNKQLIQQWIDDYGIDSDFVRVRVLGLPPRASELQYIDQTRVAAAQQRDAMAMADDPLVCGVDVSGGGSAWTVARFRKGLDGRIMAPVRIPGEQTRNRDAVIGVLAEALRDNRPGRHIDMMFIDSAFGSPIVERLRVLGFKNVQEVVFGAPSHDPHFLNQRAYMYGKCKDWLLYGAIPADDDKLAYGLTRPGYHINSSGKLIIESKADMAKRERGMQTQEGADDSDAFVLSFAFPVAPRKAAPPPPSRPSPTVWG